MFKHGYMTAVAHFKASTSKQAHKNADFRQLLKVFHGPKMQAALQQESTTLLRVTSVLIWWSVDRSGQDTCQDGVLPAHGQLGETAGELQYLSGNLL